MEGDLNLVGDQYQVCGYGLYGESVKSNATRRLV